MGTLLHELEEEKDERLTVQKESESYPIQAKQYATTIKDDASYRAGAEFLLTIKGFRKRVDEAFGPAVKKAHEAWKAVTELRKKADAPLDEAEKIIKPALARYADEQERKRREEEDRLRREQAKKEEEERLRLADLAAKSGDHKRADEILEAPPAPVVPVSLPKAEKVDGISYREVWKAEVIDLKALVDGISKGTVPLISIEANTVFLGQQARSLKGLMKYPGVKVWSEREVSGRVK